jgi:ABC-type sugar transport system ATPase subunit
MDEPLSNLDAKLRIETRAKYAAFTVSGRATI